MHINIHEILVGTTSSGFQWSTFLTSIFGVMVGGLITLFTSMYTTKKSYENNYKLLLEQEEMDTKATIKAIITEIRGVKQIFDNEFIPKICNDNAYLEYSYPLQRDYFPIFHANTIKLGKIKKDELRECIINIYITAKFFLDSLATNNEILEDYNSIYDKVHTFCNDRIDDCATQKQKEDYYWAIERLTMSKRENLLPTCQKIMGLFMQLDEILQH